MNTFVVMVILVIYDYDDSINDANDKMTLIKDNEMIEMLITIFSLSFYQSLIITVFISILILLPCISAITVTFKITIISATNLITDKFYRYK